MSDTVSLGLPSGDLFSWPLRYIPASQPPPPAGAPTLTYPPPFTIPADIFAAALDPVVPCTIAAVYAVSVKLLNIYNRANDKKPWPISKTRPFFAFVVLHNVFLAVYSAWTFVGMFRALKATVQSPFGPEGLAGTADSLCQLSGAKGLTNSVFFDQAAERWTSHTAVGAAGITEAGMPSDAVQGRLWNEGLAFYGWIFYLSKFYEVLDTLIILAKGKQSSTLQTYHHAGAMLCMWAGIRYMASPIWVFAFVNSGIHAMMYTYYTVTAFRIKVPVAIKRSLTTMQITQFLVGGGFTMIHPFISYIIPVTTTTKDASSDAETTTTTNVTQPCVSTNGEMFAIWLNVIYLAPLTYLFVKFFITSYLRRGQADAARSSKGGARANGFSKAGRRMSNVERAEQAGWDAAKGLRKEVYGDSNGESNGDDVFVEEDEEDVKVNGSANGKVNGSANGRVNGKANGRTRKA